jgi:hypothetical protein
MDTMTTDEFRQFVLASRWTFAKSMPEMPHEYTHRRWARDERLFEQAVLFIREHGYKQKFRGTTYTYYDLGGYQYWTQGSPLAATILINRARL